MRRYYLPHMCQKHLRCDAIRRQAKSWLVCKNDWMVRSSRLKQSRQIAVSANAFAVKARPVNGGVNDVNIVQQMRWETLVGIHGGVKSRIWKTHSIVKNKVGREYLRKMGQETGQGRIKYHEKIYIRMKRLRIGHKLCTSTPLVCVNQSCEGCEGDGVVSRWYDKTACLFRCLSSPSHSFISVQVVRVWIAGITTAEHGFAFPPPPLKDW